jgi:hypothetical protein
LNKEFNDYHQGTRIIRNGELSHDNDRQTFEMIIWNLQLTQQPLVRQCPCQHMQSVPITSNAVSSIPAQARCTRYNIICDKVYQWLVAGRVFPPTDRHDIAEILLKVALKTITLNPNTLIAATLFQKIYCWVYFCEDIMNVFILGFDSPLFHSKHKAVGHLLCLSFHIRSSNHLVVARSVECKCIHV